MALRLTKCFNFFSGHVGRKEPLLPDQKDSGARPEEIRHPEHPEPQTPDVDQGQLSGAEDPVLRQGPLRLRPLRGRLASVPGRRTLLSVRRHLGSRQPRR